MQAQEFSGDLVNFKKDGTALRTRLTMYPLYGDRQNRNLVSAGNIHVCLNAKGTCSAASIQPCPTKTNES